MQKNLYVLKKYLHLHPQSGNKTPVMRRTLFLWCNGNTSDSGPEIPGSSPGRTTKEMLSTGKTVFSIFVFILFGIKTPHKLLFLPPFGRKWWQEKRNVIRFDCAFFPFYFRKSFGLSNGQLNISVNQKSQSIHWPWMSSRVERKPAS